MKFNRRLYSDKIHLFHTTLVDNRLIVQVTCPSCKHVMRYNAYRMCAGRKKTTPTFSLGCNSCGINWNCTTIVDKEHPEFLMGIDPVTGSHSLLYFFADVPETSVKSPGIVPGMIYDPVIMPDLIQYIGK